MVQKALTEKFIESLPMAKASQRYDIHDARVQNLALRVGARSKVFVFIARLPDKPNPSRWKLGAYPKTSLSDARATAEAWNAKLLAGIDPRGEEEAEKRRLELRRRSTFRSVLIDYMAAMPLRKRNRNVPGDIRMLKAEFLNNAGVTFLDKPISEVCDEDIASVIIAARNRGASSTGIHVFSLMKTFFKWARAIERRKQNFLLVNPMADLTFAELELSRKERSRFLDKREVRALWLAADRTPYPFGPFCKMLLLTGQRKSDVSGARWSEIDLVEKLWIIPKERYKAGSDQLVPLSNPVIDLLDEIRLKLPENHGDLIFSHMSGRTEMNGWSNAVKSFQKTMQEIFSKENPGRRLPHWILHDLRRTARTHMSAQQVEPHIAEAVLGHGKKGIQRVYDQWRYLPQIRDALNGWADLVILIGANPSQTEADL